MAQATRVDMSLDEIIKMDNIRGRVPRASGGGGGYRNDNRHDNRQRRGGGFRSNTNRNRSSNVRPLYTSHAKRLQDNDGARRLHRLDNGGERFSSALLRTAQNNTYLGPRDRNMSNGRRSYTLHVSGLADSVSNEDIEELFSSFGQLKSAKKNYDQFGGSIGTAEVVYEQREDAVSALQKLANVPLDGHAMKIVMIGADQDEDPYSLTLRRAVRGNTGPKGNFQRGGNNRRNENLSADDLDKELDEWRSRQNASVDDGLLLGGVPEIDEDLEAMDA